MVRRTFRGREQQLPGEPAPLDEPATIGGQQPLPAEQPHGAEGARAPRPGVRSATEARSRSPLPRDAASLPPLPPAFHGVLDAALDELGLSLAPAVRGALEVHARLLLAWNRQINLTALRAPEQVALKHIADSLAAVAPLRPLLETAPRGTDRGRHLEPGEVLDLGSGAGYPGLPLGLALPAGRLALVDSVAKKAHFLEVAGRTAIEAMAAQGEPAPRLEIHPLRAEDLAHDPAHRERWAAVVARAVSALPELAELMLPLVRIGGVAVAWKRDDGRGALERELEAAVRLLPGLGGSAALDVLPVPVQGLEDHRLVLIRKTSGTPERFPRPPAERRRRLLP